MSDASGVGPLSDPAGRLLGRLRLDRSRVTLALALGLATFLLAAFNQHAPYDITPGPLARLLAWTSPGVAGAVAALAVAAPWPGLLVVTLLGAYWDAAQVGWWAGPIQVTLTTALASALVAGTGLALLRSGGRGSLAFPRASAVALAILVIATASTIGSSDAGQSAPVWLHGVVEPIVFAGLVLACRPGVLAVARLALVTGLSVALGAVINLVQTLPTITSLPDYQVHGREFFSRLTYFNIGMFGELLAMAIPLLAGLLVARRVLHLGRWRTALAATGLVISLAALYLTFQKSGWLGTAVALSTLGLALLPTMRLRLAFLGAAVVLSALVFPWPSLVLRPLAPGLADGYDRLIVALEGSDRASSWDPSTPQGEVSITERIRASGAALRMAIDHPLLGVGLDRFGATYAGPYHDPEATRALDSAHDLLPNVAAELGLVVAGLVALAMAAALVACWRTWRRPRDDLARLTAAALGSALAGWWVVSATFDPDLYRTWRLMSSDVIVAAMLVAMAVALEAAGRERQPSSGLPAEVPLRSSR